MICNFGDLYSTCNITFEDGLQVNNANVGLYFYGNNFNGAISVLFPRNTFSLSSLSNYNSPVTIQYNQQAESSSFSVGYCKNFNQPINLIDFEPSYSLYLNFDNCYKFNQNIPFITDGNKLNLHGYNNPCQFNGAVLKNCHEFNQPINIDVSLDGLVEGIRLGSMLYSCNSFNQPVNIKCNVTNSTRNNTTYSFHQMFDRCTNFDSDISITINHGYSENSYVNISFTNMLKFTQKYFTSNLNLDFKVDSPVRINMNQFAYFSGDSPIMRFDFINNCNCHVLNFAGLFARSNYDNPINIPEINAPIIENVNSRFDVSEMLNADPYFNSTVQIGDINADIISFWRMLNSCTRFNSSVIIGDIRCEDVSFRAMFQGCKNFNRPVLLGTVIANNKADFSSMFSGCENFTEGFTIPISATDCTSMFSGCINFSSSVYVPDSVGNNFSDILRGCYSYQGTISIPTKLSSSPPYGVGLMASQSTEGATISVRDSGEQAKVVRDNNSSITRYIWEES